MWPQLNVWIMAPGSACEIDDRKHWTVFTTDAHGEPFAWKNIDYTGGLKVGAPGHLECEIPPGTYIVWAELDQKNVTLRTHKAVVAVDAQPFVFVRLLPDPTLPEPGDVPEPGGECDIEIRDAVGHLRPGHDLPSVIEVVGSAEGCEDLVVSIRRADEEGVSHDSVHADGDGTWRAKFKNELGFRCGETIYVEAVCEEDRECRAERELELECRDPRGAEAD